MPLTSVVQENVSLISQLKGKKISFEISYEYDENKLDNSLVKKETDVKATAKTNSNEVAKDKKILK